MPYDVRTENTIVQLDVFGNSYRGWVWREGEAMPDEPQFDFTDDTNSDVGVITLGAVNRAEGGGPGGSTAVYSSIQIADMPIHLLPDSIACSPINGLKGDLDGDGNVGFPDFLVLSANFGNEVETYGEGDVTCDGTVGFDDFLALSANFGQSLAADGEVQVAASVPEPSASTLCFITFASLALISRRRD